MSVAANTFPCLYELFWYYVSVFGGRSRHFVRMRRERCGNRAPLSRKRTL